MTKGKEGNGEVPSGSTIGEVVLARLDADAKRRAERETARAVRKAAAEAAAVPTESVEQPAAPAVEANTARALVRAAREPRDLTVPESVDSIVEALPRVDDMLAIVDIAKDEKEFYSREVPRAKGAFEQALRDLVRVETAARTAGLDLRQGEGEQVRAVKEQMRKFQAGILKLAIYPHLPASEQGKRLLPAVRLAVAIYRKRHGTPTVPDAIRFLKEAVELRDSGNPIYQVMGREAFEELKRRIGNSSGDLQFRAIAHAGKVYIAMSRERAFLLVHEQLKEIFKLVRAGADQEKMLIAELLRQPLLEDLDLVALLRPDRPPLAERFEFAVYLGELKERTGDTARTLRLERAIGTKLISGIGAAVIAVGADPENPSLKQLTIRVATGTFQRSYLPKAVRDGGSVTIRPPPTRGEGVHSPRTPTWALALIKFLCTVKVEGLNKMREGWFKDNKSHLERIQRDVAVAEAEATKDLAAEPVIVVVNSISDAEIVDAAVEPEAPASPAVPDGT